MPSSDIGGASQSIVRGFLVFMRAPKDYLQSKIQGFIVIIQGGERPAPARPATPSAYPWTPNGKSGWDRLLSFVLSTVIQGLVSAVLTVAVTPLLAPLKWPPHWTTVLVFAALLGVTTLARVAVSRRKRSRYRPDPTTQDGRVTLPLCYEVAGTGLREDLRERIYEVWKLRGDQYSDLPLVRLLYHMLVDLREKRNRGQDGSQLVEICTTCLVELEKRGEARPQEM